MLKWILTLTAIGGGAAIYGFTGDFTLAKGVSQITSYVSLVVLLVILVASFFRGSLK